MEEGFENMVEGSVTFDKDGNIENMKSWKYGTHVDKKTGEKTVYGQETTYDKNGRVISKTEFTVQKPEQKEPPKSKDE